MLFRVVVTIAVLAGSAAADPPTGYRCAPGKPIKGADCSCPSGHRAKRDTEDVAICIALPTPTVSARFVKAVEADKLVAARDLARKYDLHADRSAVEAFGKHFKSWREGLVEKLELLASRGQCSAIDPLLAPRRDYEAIVAALADGFDAIRPGSNVADRVHERMITWMKPLDDLAEKCIEVASRDDGTSKMASEYRAHHRPLSTCLHGAPEPKAPVKALVVVDADGKVVRVTINGTWTDVEETADKADAKYRKELRDAREQCIQKVMRGWSFKPNAHGFSGSPIIAGPGAWPAPTGD